MQDLYLQSAVRISKLIKSKEISVEDYVKSLLGRLKTKEDSIHAWQYFDEQLFLDKANNIDNNILNNSNKGALLGIPVGIKDVYNTRDMPAEMGSTIWKGFTPGNNARVVDSIVHEDGIVMGKTVTAEFAVHYPGPTLNPHNSNYLVGTSSSGSAAAVASGMVPLALGTQTAGSTTRPASYCGIYGFKPSYGVIPRTGILKTLDTLDHVSILSRGAKDTKFLFDVLRVKGENYPYVFKNMDSVPQNFLVEEPIKIAFVKSNKWGNLKDYTQEAIYAFADKLASTDSIIVEEINIDEILGGIHEHHHRIYSKALSYYFRDEYVQHFDLLSKSFKMLVEQGQKVSPEKYTQSLAHQVEAQAYMDKFFKNYDVILSPSTVGEAPTLDEPLELDDTALMWTYLHVPTVSVPIARGPNDMPFSIQLISKRYDDYKLLSFIENLEDQQVIPAVQIA